MDKPRLKDLMVGFDSKYTLVIVAAKRARQLTDASTGAVNEKFLNPVSAALHEIVNHDISWERV